MFGFLIFDRYSYSRLVAALGTLDQAFLVFVTMAERFSDSLWDEVVTSLTPKKAKHVSPRREKETYVIL